MSDRFEDGRGVIQDLLVTRLDAVAEIYTVKGAVRGNHYHEHTTQWTYVVYGRLRVFTRPDVVHFTDFGPGDMVEEKPGIPHAWLALQDTKVLVFTKGPRSGQNYEKDVVRLPEPEWLV